MRLFLLKQPLLFLFPILFLFLPTTPGHAQQERIISYDSRIQIQPSAILTVEETIKVYASGQEIKRGIYRDFPTHYKDRNGNNYKVSFKVLHVLRDGREENFFLKAESNGMRVYVGEKERLLPPGEYTYTIVFETDRQLGFFKDFDELYFNAIGTGWSFPIERAKVVVELPKNARHATKEVDAYSGYQGKQGKDFINYRDESGRIVFETTRTLFPREGFTVVIGWEKGFVHGPTQAEKLKYVFNDNKGSLLGLLGLIGIFVFYYGTWSRVGKDPEKGTIIPLYEPPANFSPAVVRYLMKMGYDQKVYGAAIINMAVKGYLKIKEDSGSYSLIRQGKSRETLSADEKAVADNIFGGQDVFEVKSANHQRINKSIQHLKKSLDQTCEKNYFLTNVQYFTGGLVISIAVIILSVIFESKQRLPMACFIGLWLSIWTIGVVTMVHQLVSLWRGVMLSKGKEPLLTGGALFMSLFAAPFVGGEIFGLGILAYSTSVFLMVIITLIGVVNILFFNLLKAPTLLGRKILDEIEGFKMYLSVAEKDRLNELTVREKTPEYFEKYLPYALSMGVEQAWAEKFSEVFKQMPNQEYQPVWYLGHGFPYQNVGGFASSIGSSVSNAISSSAVAPGSSSGGGGGGSSGGGGGGGGGGGW
jgi:uncharacterized membrane protein